MLVYMRKTIYFFKYLIILNLKSAQSRSSLLCLSIWWPENTPWVKKFDNIAWTWAGAYSSNSAILRLYSVFCGKYNHYFIAWKIEFESTKMICQMWVNSQTKCVIFWSHCLSTTGNHSTVLKERCCWLN